MMLKVSGLVNQNWIEICEIFIVVEEIVTDDDVGVLIIGILLVISKKFAYQIHISSLEYVLFNLLKQLTGQFLLAMD